MSDPHPPFESLLGQIAARTPSPGGGYVASAVGALGAALGSMVLAYSIGKKSLSQHDETNSRALERLEHSRRELLELAHQDALAYQRLNTIQRADESQREDGALLEASRDATQVPMSASFVCSEMLETLESLATTTNTWLASDLAIAAILANAALKSCVWNIRINLPTLLDAGESADRVSLIRRNTEQQLRGAQEMADRIESFCAQA
ncbi:MAG: cyclodeaminase/cyclohydrolase family protein [Phycisphaerales bacterium JB043]